MAKAPPIIWQNPRAGSMPMDAYRRHINSKFNQSFNDTRQLQRWTVASQQDFWLDLWDYLRIIPPLPPNVTRAYDESLPMSSVPPFFEGVHLNYAENTLERRDPNAVALIGLREGQSLDGEQVTWSQLRERVRAVRSALRRRGLRKGQVVAALVSNSIWAVALFLATASVGAVFTSINPDLGEEGCVSRLNQVDPVFLFADSDATYKGRQNSMMPKLRSLLKRIKKKPEIFVIPVSANKSSTSSGFRSLGDFLQAASPDDQLSYDRVPFMHPLIICYSSGTTGAPKCIVHHHGLCLQLKKISMLHQSLGPNDTVLQFSSTSWVMFYIMMGHFSTGAKVITYDGSPMWPDVRQLLKILERHKVTYFGSSPRYLFELEKARCIPKREFDLASLRMINTTGAPLSDDQYRWVYSNFDSKQLHLCNSAGSTDCATSLIASDPCGPLRLGEMQLMGLGMDVDVADTETGASVGHTGEPGEMVVRKAFPSMPPFLWGDEDGSTYRASYFERFKEVDVWAQHDWMSINPATGGFVMHGRSDGVLNPSGIRFGSSEIYAITESPAFSQKIAETLCVGRKRVKDTDESVFLFVRLADGQRSADGGLGLSDDLRRRLREAIRDGLSARHIPRYIIEVDDIPVTINGKKVETAVKKLISGKDVAVSSTVANPDVLRGYARWADYEEKRPAKL